MSKSPSKEIPVEQQILQLEKLIKTCQKFIGMKDYNSITIIFAGKYNGFDTTEMVKIDNPDSSVPITELFEFFNNYGANLIAKKLLLQDGHSIKDVNDFVGGMEALKESINKNFK